MSLLAWNWSIFWYDISIEIFGSLVFLFGILIVFRPWVSISPFLCKNQSEFQNEGTMYFLKIVNKSLFTAYDIEVELAVLQRRPTPPSGMTNVRMVPLNLVYNSHSYLPGYRPRWIRKDAAHCLRFRTKENLDSIILDDFKSVRVQVTLKHGLTGLVKVFTNEYSDIQEIREGRFSYGTKFGVI
ncbi:MAG TPA: hypothetical protein VK644_10640 [Chitinophagaceae bacterium]|nr:hypothetical protein [Chitinophagaceae bacterium]